MRLRRGRAPFPFGPATRLVLVACLFLLLVPAPGSATATGATAEADHLSAATAVTPTVSPAAASEVSLGTERPLVIVLDTSASMSEEDVDGTIKLAGAQAALTRMLRNQRPDALVGLWTFPTGSCGPGRSVIDAQALEHDEMIRAVRGLEAGGDTPTGGALRAVVNDLKADGYEGATILLISDGLSNCDPDPCKIAEDIVADGFDITVEAAGFQISAEGKSELECIADATGGGVHEARDAEELNQLVTDVTDTRLTVRVEGMPASISAGSSRRITVTVTNETARDIRDSRIAFSFANAGDDGQPIIPSVLPPLVSLGGIPVGEKQQRSWLVSFGTPGKTGDAGYRITAWGSNSQPTTAQGFVNVVDQQRSLAEAGELLRDLSGKRIAILGDSFSSGEGAGNYQPGTDSRGGGAAACHKSNDTYLLPLFGDENVELLACSGAITRYLTQERDGEERFTNAVQEEQVGPLLEGQQGDRGPVAAAFMTVGGNDVKFSDIIARCVFNFSLRQEYLPVLGKPWAVIADELVKYGFAYVNVDSGSACADDERWVEEVLARPQGIHGDLLSTYRKVYDALNDPSVVDKRGGEIAPLYIVAYPQIFGEPQWMSRCPFFDPREVQFANDLVDALNNQIEKAVLQRRRDGDRIQLIRATQEAFLPDNTACPRPRHEQWVNSLDFWAASKKVSDLAGGHSSNEYMHPNAAGYLAETNAMLDWSTWAKAELPKGHDDWREPEDPTSLLVAEWMVDHLTPTLPATGPGVFDATAQQWTTDPMDIRAGQPVELEVVNAAPSSTVTFSIESRPQLLGSVAVDEQGRGRATFRVPALLPPGAHRLTAVGFAGDGSPAMAHQSVDVARYIPWWLTPLAAVVLLSVVLAGVLYGTDRRARRREAQAVAHAGEQREASAATP